MDREAESLALEKKHVRDVYDRIAPHFSDTRYKAWPRVKEFLLELEPGSIVADVGCGNGKYLGINNQTYKIGSDCCEHLVDISAKRGHQAMVCDNLRLPYRDNCFDAVISIAVVHHFATAERRAQAIRELARICRPGGLVMVYVWALEQKQRQFDAQDVLVPWHFQPKNTKTRRVKGKHNNIFFNHLSSSSASDDDVTERMLWKSRKGHHGNKVQSKLVNGKMHPGMKAIQNEVVRSRHRESHTLQRHTEKEWLRGKFFQSPRGFSNGGPKNLRKSYSCEEETVLLSRKNHLRISRCLSEGGSVKSKPIRSSSVEEGKKGEGLWDGFLQLFPARFSPSFTELSEDDIPLADISNSSVFGDDEDDVKNQWCVIHKDGSVGTYEGGSKPSRHDLTTVGSRASRLRHKVKNFGSVDSGMPKLTELLGNVKKQTSPLLNSKSFDEADLSKLNSLQRSCDKNGAIKVDMAFDAISVNSESAINTQSLCETSTKVTASSSDSSGFISSSSVTLDSAEVNRRLFTERKQHLKLNLRPNIPDDKGVRPVNGMFARESLELWHKTEGNKTKKPVVGLNFTTAKGELYKPYRSLSKQSVLGWEKDRESSIDSISSSDESLTTIPVKAMKSTKQKPSKGGLPSRSQSLSTLENLKGDNLKVTDNVNQVSPEPSSQSLSPPERTRSVPDVTSPKCHNQVICNGHHDIHTANNSNHNSIQHTASSTDSPNHPGEAGCKEPTEGTKENSHDDPSQYLRYYHVFKEGELIDLIERNVENLHIVKSYYDHANWCVVAEKVEVWRI